MSEVKRFDIEGRDWEVIEGRDWVTSENFDRVTAERDALQELLNQRDEANHDLKQRSHAEQQACQAAERRVDELEDLVRMVRDNGGYLEDYEWDRIDAALNPTAEAASHEE